MDFLTYLGAISDDETSYDVLRTVLGHFYYLSEQIDKFCMNFCKKKTISFFKDHISTFCNFEGKRAQNGKKNI